MRHKNDFYETAPWQVRALLNHQVVEGSIMEPCAGDWSIAHILTDHGFEVVTNDIDESRIADYHTDAADPALYDNCKPDWIITNPPYQMPPCRDIVINAVQHARVGIAMMLRLSFLEPTAKVNPRGPFLAHNPPNRLLVLPRYSFTGNGKSDSMTTAWYIWYKKPENWMSYSTQIECLYEADLQ